MEAAAPARPAPPAPAPGTSPFSAGVGFRPVRAPAPAASLATPFDWSRANRSTDTTASQSEAPAATAALAPPGSLNLLAEAINRAAPPQTGAAAPLGVQVLQALTAQPELGRLLAALTRDHCGVPAAAPSPPIALPPPPPPAPAISPALSAKLAAMQAEIAARKRDLAVMESYVANRYLELAQTHPTASGAALSTLELQLQALATLQAQLAAPRPK